MVEKPIESYFPIKEVNHIAKRESGGGASKIYFRPVIYMHKTFATRLGSIFRSILLQSLLDNESEYFDEEAGEWKKVPEDTGAEDIWKDYYLKDVRLGNKVILDPFFGSGVTLVEALRLGIKVVGKELNPVPWFVAKKELEPLDLEVFNESIMKAREFLKEEILPYYKTSCPECSMECDVIYYFWVKEVFCPDYEKPIPLFKNYEVASMRSSNVEHKGLIRCEKCQHAGKPVQDTCPSCSTPFDYANYSHVLCPSCGGIFGTSILDRKNACPSCGEAFTPRKGTTKGITFNCPKGHKKRIIDYVRSSGKLDERLYAIEYYCEKCDRKGYKKAQQEDFDLFNKAREEFLKLEPNLTIPHQAIPMGFNTKQIMNHGYKYFKDMFNHRQLLCLGRFLDYLKNDVEDRNHKEFLLLAFSAMLECNNSWGCLYETHHNKIGNAFSKHAYHPRSQFIENNFALEKFGGGTFNAKLKQIKRGKKYCSEPFEKYVSLDGKDLLEKSMKNKITGRFVSRFQDLDTRGNVLLLNGSSETLEIPDESLDAIITDPPYSGNVNYSELYNYFYVWLRYILKDEYPNFKPELTPDEPEVVKNPFQNKGDIEYQAGLVKIFKECHEKLKHDGILAFTFHHQGIEAWIAILNSIFKSNFIISNVYPIQAEMGSSAHIFRKENVESDILFVCRKRNVDPKPREWEDLKSEIREMAREQEKIGELAGKSSEYYSFLMLMAQGSKYISKHWPNIVHNGSTIEIDSIIKDLTMDA
ncbi:MAG: DUF1156 domain-containing protein [Candidatus Hodarchaeota archaeon]